MALTTKIEKLNGKYYYRDQWSGTLMQTRYGIPREKGHQRGVTLKGTFKDPCAAVAWIKENSDNGNLDKEKGLRYMASIHVDCDLSEHQKRYPEMKLYAAPKVNPENPDFSYQLTHDFMMHPRSGYTHISVEENALKLNQEKREKKVESQKLSRLYTIDPSENGAEEKVSSTPAFLLSAEKNKSIELGAAITVRKIVSTEYKGKPCVLLSEEDTLEENDKVAFMFKKHGITTKGRCHVVIQKPLHDDGAEEGQVTLSLAGSKAASPKKKRETKEEIHLKIDNEISTQFFSNASAAKELNEPKIKRKRA